MHSSRSNRSTIKSILQSAGFLPLVFVIVSITLWIMFVNSFHNKKPLAKMIYSPENTVSTFSGEKFFNQQNIITRPESKTHDLQTLTMQLMEKYQGLELAENQKYIEALIEDNRFVAGVSNTNTTLKEKQINQMELKSNSVSPTPLQNSVNKLFSESQDTIDTDYMNNLNMDSVTSVLKQG